LVSAVSLWRPIRGIGVGLANGRLTRPLLTKPLAATTLSVAPASFHAFAYVLRVWRTQTRRNSPSE
jgi:hypothetical protein